MPNRGKAKAKAKGKKPHRKSPPPSDNPNRPRVIPREIISNILSRLPVKTLLQLRTVCKQWRSLISSPKFVSAHLSRTETIVYFHARAPSITTLMKSLVSSGQIDVVQMILKPTSVTSKPNFSESEVAGCVNGVICMSRPPWARDLVLWNPTTQISRSVFYPGPGPNPTVNSKVSVGFGLDSRTDDYNIVLIMAFHLGLDLPDIAYVYSLRTGRWKEVKLDLKFWVQGTKSEASIAGLPHWKALEKDVVGFRPVLVYFDGKKEVFGSISLPLVVNDTDVCAREFRGKLGMVVWPKSITKERLFDVWTRDDENGWSKNFSVGPVSEFDRVVGFDEDRGIIGGDEEGNLFTYYFEDSRVEESCPFRRTGRGSIYVVRFKQTMVPIAGNGLIF